MTKRSPLNWRFFRRTVSDNKLFGKSLPTGGDLPLPVINMLQQLYCKGPFTVGIFRKSANARLCREVEARLEEDPEYALDDVPITVVGSVFKDFLRSLPNSLLDSRLLNKWIEAVTCDDADQQREAVDKLLKKLPSESLQLLQHVLCLLWHIAQRSSVNKMCPSNLAVCIGPSLLSSSKIISPVRREEVSKNVPKVICYLIDHCPDLFGESVLTLLGPELEPVRPDSGAEVSDSSCNSLQESSGGSAAGTGSAPQPDSCLTSDVTSSSDRGCKNKTSLSNLSRDSGLTASDTQLYSAGEQEQDALLPSDEEKMFSLPPAASAAFERIKSCSPNSMGSRTPASACASGKPGSGGKQQLGSCNLHLQQHDNNNSNKCVNRVLSTSIPHLNTDELESMLNGTFSYGKSIGVGINGSCQEVVRNRKRHQVLQSSPMTCLSSSSSSQAQVHQADHPQTLLSPSTVVGQTTAQTPTYAGLQHRCCKSPLIALENRLLTPATTASAPLHQHHNRALHRPFSSQHLNCVNRLFSKSVPHLNSIGFRNSVTFSPSPRRATRVNLHAWSYDVTDPRARPNQSLPINSLDHYQPLHSQRDKCMYRCRATPFISCGSSGGSAQSGGGYVRNNAAIVATTSAAVAAGAGTVPIGHSAVTVNGKRVSSLPPSATGNSSSSSSSNGNSTSNSQCSYSPFGAACPPSYQETMDRKKFAARLQSNVSLFRKISFDGVYEQFELRL